jgi:hypothetical protein
MLIKIHRFPARRPSARPDSVAPLFPGSDPMAEPDSNWSLIAADLVRVGGRPEAVLSLPGLRPETALGLAGLMTAHAAAGVTAILEASGQWTT